MALGLFKLDVASVETRLPTGARIDPRTRAVQLPTSETSRLRSRVSVLEAQVAQLQEVVQQLCKQST